MSENCGGTCSSCGENCADRQAPESFLVESNPESNVKKVIGIVSGKGGVGKSMVTSMLAVKLNRRGYSTAILDADITGPSIPKAFGIAGKAMATEDGQYILPVISGAGTKIMSINLLLEDDSDPVVFRGPVIAGTVKQFWSDVAWGNVDYMLVDMPPGTGDVPLTVFQSLPVDGILVVASPQELVSMVVSKAVKMAQLMDIPIIGLVENMSYIECPDCGKKIELFGKSHLDEIAEDFGLSLLARIPIDPEVAAACDSGRIEICELSPIDDIACAVENFNATSKIAVTFEDGEVFQHFGHTENFKVYTISRGAIVSSEVISAEGEGHGSLAGFLKQKGVGTLICGGIGGGAKNALAEAGIKLVAGATGDADKNVIDYLSGILVNDETVECNHHSHENGHSCGGAGHSCGHSGHDCK